MSNDFRAPWAYANSPIAERREVELDVTRASFELVPVKPSSAGVGMKAMGCSAKSARISILISLQCNSATHGEESLLNLSLRYARKVRSPAKEWKACCSC